MNIDHIKEVIQKEKPFLEKEYGLTSIGIFGSHVRGEEKPDSDIDLLVEFNKSFGLLTFVKLEHYLEDKLGRDVDLVMKRALKPNIGKYILNEVQYL